jgi:hypothetical protein
VATHLPSIPRRLRLALLGAVAALAFAPNAHAGLLPSCPGTFEKPFAQWGDSASYALVGDGGFERGGLGWSLAGGAKVVAGNESFYVHASGDSRSLLLPRGSSATSPPVCMVLGRPKMRFFAVAPAGSGSLRVDVLSRNLLGVLSVIDGGVVTAGSAWQPSPAVSLLGSNLGSALWATWVQLRFRPLGDASLAIDDVYVDPWVIR